MNKTVWYSEEAGKWLYKPNCIWVAIEGDKPEKTGDECIIMIETEDSFQCFQVMYFQTKNGGWLVDTDGYFKD